MSTPSVAILGCGWLGLPLGSHLAQAGHSVFGSTTTPDKLPALRAAGIRPLQLRLGPDTKPGEIDPLLRYAEVLVLNVPPSRTATDRDAYAAALQPVAEALGNSPVRRVVFVSSTGVYPDEPRLMLEPDAVAAPDAASHLLRAEWVFGQPYLPWRTTVLRLGGLMGPGRAPGRFLAGRTDVPQPKAPVNMLHLTDAVGVVEAVISQQAWGHTLNVCADEHPTRREFYTAATEQLGLPAPQFTPHDERSGKLISTECLHHILSYRFHHPDPLAALAYC